MNPPDVRVVSYRVESGCLQMQLGGFCASAGRIPATSCTRAAKLPGRARSVSRRLVESGRNQDSSSPTARRVAVRE